VERFGFVGLPNAGKSSLFNALSGGGALAAPYPFATKDPNVGSAKVPDHRLDKLTELSKSKKRVPATVEFLDIGGLVAGASQGEGLGNKFLGGIREVDAIVYVLRAFVDDDVVGPSDPLEHLQTVEIELALADLQSIESQLPRKQKQLKLDKSLADEVAALEAAYKVLEAGTPIYRSDLSEDIRTALAPAFLLTNKPVLAVVNVGEDDVERGPEIAAPVAELLTGSEVLPMCIQLEAEAAQVDNEQERLEMLEGFGLGEGALARMIRAAYHLLGRRTFLTTGEKESRAWTFRAGAKAPECAGVIHSDLQRGFIKAETIWWEELVQLGSMSAARDAGKLRVEGKDYEVQDGDVLDIRFNV
jgi:ribosome-binding ATPase